MPVSSSSSAPRFCGKIFSIFVFCISYFYIRKEKREFRNYPRSNSDATSFRRDSVGIIIIRIIIDYN